MKNSKPQSRYGQITNEFRQFILNGDWPVNEMIKTEQELSQIYSVSRLTIRNALMRLVHEGLLDRRSGKGTWVRDFQQSQGIWNIEDISQYFIYPEHISTVIIGTDDLVASSSPVSDGQFEAEEILMRIRLVRYFKKTPFAYNHIYLRTPDAEAVLEGFDPERDIFLYQILEKKTGRTVVEIHERTMAEIATGETALRLKVEQGHPVLKIHRDLLDGDGHHIQTNIMYLNTDVQAMKTIRTKGPSTVNHS